MVAAAQSFLDAFDALPQAVRHEVLDEILCRAALEYHGLPSGEELTAAADNLFLHLDQDEQPQAISCL
jgi:hypothetical protein